MNHRRQRRHRPGFTLLEVMLATGIAVLLLGGLYVAVDMQLRFAQDSRDVLQESTLSRALFYRMDTDASQVVGLCDPGRYRLGVSSTGTSLSGATADTGTSSATTTSSGATNTSSSSTTTSSSAASSTSSTSSSSSTTTDSGTAIPIILPLGVEGDSETLHLFFSRLPREALAYLNDPTETPPVVGDLRRVSYWLAGGDGSPTGLARQEIPLVTSDDALQNLPPGIDNEDSYVIADEVRSLKFPVLRRHGLAGQLGLHHARRRRRDANRCAAGHRRYHRHRPAAFAGQTARGRFQFEDVSPRPRHPVRQRDHSDAEPDGNDGNGQHRDGHDGGRLYAVMPCQCFRQLVPFHAAAPSCCWRCC